MFKISRNGMAAITFVTVGSISLVSSVIAHYAEVAIFGPIFGLLFSAIFAIAFSEWEVEK